MTFRVIVQPRAELDIEAAAYRLLDQSQSPAVALRWVQGIRAAIDTLKDMPLRCPVAPDTSAFGEAVRVLLYGKRKPYRVLFAVRGDAVHVLTVRPPGQRPLDDRQDDDDDTIPLH